MPTIRTQHLEADIKNRANWSGNKPKLRKHNKDV